MKHIVWNSDKMLSISAFLISLMTLGVFVYQTRLMRQQQHLSVLPYLSVSFRAMSSPDFNVVLANEGIGPAFVESVKIKYEGKTYDMDLPKFLANHVPAMDTVKNYFFSNVYPGRMIPAGEDIEVLSANNSMKTANDLEKVLAELSENGLDYEIIYRSVYNDRWKLTGENSIPKEL